MGQVDQEPGIELEPDRHAVERHRRHVPELAVLFLPSRPQAGLLGIGRLDVRGRADLDRTRRSVGNDSVTRLDQ
jgi:hypothetical protein